MELGGTRGEREMGTMDHASGRMKSTWKGLIESDLNISEDLKGAHGIGV